MGHGKEITMLIDTGINITVKYPVPVPFQDKLCRGENHCEIVPTGLGDGNYSLFAANV